MPTDLPVRRQAILVLGMHRSGTSAVGGVLAKLGVEPPKTLMEPARDNARGFWESKEIVAFHERLLTTLGSAWSDWAEIDDDSLGSAKAVEQLPTLPDLIEREFGDARLFFVKDPRICRFPGIWLRAFAAKGIEAKAVIPIRLPAEVACSLESRNRLGTARSHLIWLRHVLDAEYATRGIRRAIVPYAGLLASWRTEVERMAVELAVEWPIAPDEAAPRIEEFLHADLRHFSQVEANENSRLDGWVNETYALVQELGREGDGAAMQRLDAIRREFNLATSMFAPAFREAESAHAEATTGLRKRLDAKPDAAEPTTADIVAAVDRKLTEVASRLKVERQAELSKLAEAMQANQQAQRAEIRKLSESLRASADRHRVALEALSGELQYRKQEADDLQSKLHAESEEIASLRRRFEQSNELYRHESATRAAINAELERVVAERSAALAGSRQELHQLKSAHESDTAALQQEVARQRRIAERTRSELDLVHNSRGFRVLQRLRRALGRGTGALQGGVAADIEAIESSGLFNRQWYMERYPDVAGSGMDPVEHYLEFGAIELRDPGPEFDSRSYFERYPDVKEGRFNPLLHYIHFGRREGRTCEAAKSR